MLVIALAVVVGIPCVASAQSTRVTPGWQEKEKARREKLKADEAKAAADAKAKADKKREENANSGASAPTSLGDPTTTTLKNEDGSTAGTVTVEPKNDKNGDPFFRYIITVDDGKCRKSFGFDFYPGPPPRVIPHPIELTEPSPRK